LISSYRPPLVVQKLFIDFIWQTSNDKILLTFDDGPTDRTTPIIFDTLNRYKIKAVFFCVGENVQKFPELTKQLINDGHLIANHTMKHKLIPKISRYEAEIEIKSFNNLLKEKFNYDVKYFRPPHGRFNFKTNGLLKKQNLKCVMWSLLSHDYKNKFKKVKHGVDQYLKRNSIMVFHDNLKSNSIIEESINYTIDVVAKKGFEFGEPEDCLK
jgi:peptidoglycan/xylan/chitin deacetylase (PgdA/CDA1 family)